MALMSTLALGGCSKTYTYAPFGAPCAGKLPDGETGFMRQGAPGFCRHRGITLSLLPLYGAAG